MKRLSWKYIAGLVDGIGCIQINWHKKTIAASGIAVIHPQIGLELTLAESSKHVIDMLHANHGGTVYRREHESSNWKPTYTWRLYNKKDVRAFFQNIINHCYTKDQQMRLTIWCIDNLKSGLSEEFAKVLKEEFKLQKGDPHRLSEVAVDRMKLCLSTDAIVGLTNGLVGSLE